MNTMYTVYINNDLVDAFQNKYGKAAHATQHGHQVCLHYESLPKKLLKTSGGWYSVTMSLGRDGQRALELAGNLFNEVYDYEP